MFPPLLLFNITHPHFHFRTFTLQFEGIHPELWTNPHVDSRCSKRWRQKDRWTARDEWVDRWWVRGEMEAERREGEVLMNGLMAHWPTNVTAALPVAPPGLVKYTHRDLCVNYNKTQVRINCNTPVAFLHCIQAHFCYCYYCWRWDKRGTSQFPLTGIVHSFTTSGWFPKCVRCIFGLFVH